MNRLSHIFACIAFLIFPNISNAALEDIIKATCAVNRGSGVVYNQDESHIWIVTAAHCILDNNEQLEKIYTQFFNSGKNSELLETSVVWYKYNKGTTTDLAILKLSKDKFGQYPIPQPILIAPVDRQVNVGEVIVSCGCAGKNHLECVWPTAWMGHVTYVDDVTFKFLPTPLPGRSGSGIFDKEGKVLLGIIILRDGTTVPLTKIYKLTKWK